MTKTATQLLYEKLHRLEKRFRELQASGARPRSGSNVSTSSKRSSGAQRSRSSSNVNANATAANSMSGIALALAYGPGAGAGGSRPGTAGTSSSAHSNSGSISAGSIASFTPPSTTSSAASLSFSGSAPHSSHGINPHFYIPGSSRTQYDQFAYLLPPPSSQGRGQQQPQQFQTGHGFTQPGHSLGSLNPNSMNSLMSSDAFAYSLPDAHSSSFELDTMEMDMELAAMNGLNGMVNAKSEIPGMTGMGGSDLLCVTFSRH